MKIQQTPNLKFFEWKMGKQVSVAVALFCILVVVSNPHWRVKRVPLRVYKQSINDTFPAFLSSASLKHFFYSNKVCQCPIICDHKSWSVCLRVSSSIRVWLIKSEIDTKHLLALLIQLLSHAGTVIQYLQFYSTLQVIKFSLLYFKELFSCNHFHKMNNIHYSQKDSEKVVSKLALLIRS